MCIDSQGTCLAGCPEREDAAQRCSVRVAGLATGATLPLLPGKGIALWTVSHLGRTKTKNIFVEKDAPG